MERKSTPKSQQESCQRRKASNSKAVRKGGSSFRPCPQYGWDFPDEIPEEFRKEPGNALRAFPWNSPRQYGWEPPIPYNSRPLKPPEHFQNSLSLRTAGDASFSDLVPERASELIMKFPAILGHCALRYDYEINLKTCNETDV